jgi:hypothetical protein
VGATRIDRYGGTEIFSIFGQIEEVVATVMLEEGKGRRIELQEFPDVAMCPEVHVNEAGQRAKFAVQFSRHETLEFNRRVAELYA